MWTTYSPSTDYPLGEIEKHTHFSQRLGNVAPGVLV